MHKTINFLGIEVGALAADDIIGKILEYALTDKAKFITYLNAHCVNTALIDNEYKKILQKADLVYTGGQGVVWAARFLGNPLPERVNILDFFDRLVSELKDRKITIYLLGGREGTVKKTAEALKAKGLRIVGSREGFFAKSEEQKIIQEINSLKPNILMVGMGVPKQEKWIANNIGALNVNLYWAVGAVFDWLSGQRKRAPNWMIKFGLEWLHRLWQQPKRLWKRYLLGNLIFIHHILRCKLSGYEKNN
ncbi:MAG: WecB/TagA/CpsF family glycosyltransferase [Candidatus Omnitrophica bacterium]|nr:WecB/TagA/CpsF family glycosyltransferase [Candidatus Omnitrophota bacterium]